MSKMDMTNRTLVKTVPFPAGSKPHMLRVSPDGREVWVQTVAANTNVVLSADDLSVLSTQPTGMAPVTNAWSPDRRYSIITNAQDTVAQVVDATTFRELKRLPIGPGGSNIGFTRDGKTGFIAVSDADAVAVIDAEKLSVTGHVKAGATPQGLIIR